MGPDHPVTATGKCKQILHTHYRHWS